MSKAHEIFDYVLPDVDTLWNAGDARMRTIEIDPGHFEEVAYFNVGIDNPTRDINELGVRPIFSDNRKRGRTIGQVAAGTITTSDGAERPYEVRRLYDSERSDVDYSVTRGAAWWTTGGKYSYNGDRLDALAREPGLESLWVGTPHDTRKLPFPLEVLRVPGTMKHSLGHSLAKSAQGKQHSFDALMRHYDLARKQYKVSDSMDDMETAGEYVHATELGNPIIQFDNHAKCGLEDLGLGDMPDFGRWVRNELINMPGLGFDLIRSRDICRVIGSVSMNPNFITQTLIGNLRSVASDEASRMMRWMPRLTEGHETLYKGDGMSERALREQMTDTHPNIFVKEVDGVHLHIVRSKAKKGIGARATRYANQYQAHSGDTDKIDRSYVYHANPSLEEVA